VNDHFTRKFRVWGLLALPLAAVVVLALMLAWGQGSSQQAQATSGANSPDLHIESTGCSTESTTLGKCNVSSGSSFSVATHVDNIGGNFADGADADAVGGYGGFQAHLTYSAGLTLNNKAGTSEVVWPDSGFPVESKGVGSYTGGSAIGIGANGSVFTGQVMQTSFTCSAVGVETVTLVQSADPLDSNLADENAVAKVDPDGNEVLTINCLPPAQNINVNVTNAAGGEALSSTCVLVGPVVNIAPPGSPPVLQNIPLDVVSDNNSKAPCDGVLGGPLSDSNPAVGSLNIAISGALRLTYGDTWHVQQVQGNAKYDLDNTKYECDLSLGKCTVDIANNQVSGTITANFFSNPAGGGAPVPLVSADGVAENCISVDAGAPQCTTAATFTTANLPVGPHTVDFTSCENGLAIDEKGGANPANTAVNIGAPTKFPSVDFHCASPDMFNLKLPSLANLFLHAQGTKLEPSTCEAGGDSIEFQHLLSNAPSQADPKGLDSRQVVNGFEFEVWFDQQWICVDLNGGDYVTNNGLDCLTDAVDGGARIGCFGPKLSAATVDESSLELATITVKPQPELYSQIVANQDNGISVQILNKGCNLTDQQGHGIDKLVGGVPSSSCDDSAVTIRWLEGDVNGSGAVDAADCQILSFRWGVGVGSLLYNERFDLEPSGADKFDGDIDIKDVQFCFGRIGSTTTSPHPPQDPVNPKTANPPSGP
jgi:hypothetical protein